MPPSTSGSSQPLAASDASDSSEFDCLSIPDKTYTDKQYSYGDRMYWDRRYNAALDPESSTAPAFDWYMGYAGLRGILKEHIPRDCPVLQVGCGTSMLQRDMAEDGYTDILSVDNSSVAVEYMQSLHADISALRYELVDCRHMPQYDNGSFGAVLDKGTLDAILCGDSPEVDAASLLSECLRVLEPGGVLLVASYGPPHRRLPYLLLPLLHWKVCVYGVRQPEDAEEPLVGPFPPGDAESQLDRVTGPDGFYYVYVCQKEA